MAWASQLSHTDRLIETVRDRGDREKALKQAVQVVTVSVKRTPYNRECFGSD